jgi:hypothetical protein
MMMFCGSLAEMVPTAALQLLNVEAHLPEAGLVPQRIPNPAQVVRLDRRTGLGSENIADIHPLLTGRQSRGTNHQ